MNVDVDVLLGRAREAKRESKRVEFKEEFDPGEESEWIELIKDFAALANSQGGVVVVGLRNNGTLSGADVQPVLDLDGATICDKLKRYIGTDFDAFEVHDVVRDGTHLAAIVIDGVEDAPLAFVQGGNYVDARNRPKSAFARGAVYVRHGAKSEPATTEDLRKFIDWRVEVVREKWLGNIGEVMAAPPDSRIAVVQTQGEDAEGLPTTIRLSTDADAPLYGMLDPDVTHPYRQTELIEEVNSRLPAGVSFNQYDSLCIRRVHEIDGTNHPEFAHESRFGLAQYSDAFVDWIVEQYNANNDFFAETRQRYYDMTHG